RGHRGVETVGQERRAEGRVSRLRAFRSERADLLDGAEPDALADRAVPLADGGDRRGGAVLGPLEVTDDVESGGRPLHLDLGRVLAEVGRPGAFAETRSKPTTPRNGWSISWPVTGFCRTSTMCQRPGSGLASNACTVLPWPTVVGVARNRLLLVSASSPFGSI